MDAGDAMTMDEMGDGPATAVLLYWLPLGAGGRLVRGNGRLYEAFAARRQHRAARDLYHSALEVRLAPTARDRDGAGVGAASPDRGVVADGPVGSPSLGRLAAFRYEVRRWRMGIIPDVAEAVDSPRRHEQRPDQRADGAGARAAVPPPDLGARRARTGEMWNSNSLIAWLLARSGHDVAGVRPPPHGRAPGWQAGLILAARGQAPVGEHPGGEPSPNDRREVPGSGRHPPTLRV